MSSGITWTCPTQASPLHRAARRGLLDQQHHILHGVGLRLRLSHLCEHALGRHVGAGGHPAGLSLPGVSGLLILSQWSPSDVVKATAVKMGIEDQLRKSKFLGRLPLHCLPLTFCKTSFELVDRHAPLQEVCILFHVQKI